MKSNKNLKAGILGAGGFTGQELIRICSRHEGVEVVYITSEALKGNTIREAFPALDNPRYKDLRFSGHPTDPEDLPELDVLFLAVPDETSIHWVKKLANSSVKIIDISGAFRLKDPEIFEKYYGLKHEYIRGLQTAVYGLTEINRDKIRTAQLLANPGCYATSAILPVLLLKDFLIEIESNKIIVDAKSGTSGAGGRKEKDGLPYSFTHENFRAYKIRAHQHTPEIAQEIAPAFPQAIQLNMVPQLLPLFRGLQTNTYIYLKKFPDIAQIAKSMETRLSKETFVRFYDDPEKISLRNVQNTNYIDFGVHFDKSTGLLQIIGALDNLVKGAAGQAIQNMNLMFGLPETQGLL